MDDEDEPGDGQQGSPWFRPRRAPQPGDWAPDASGLADPLTDPLPGPPASPRAPEGPPEQTRGRNAQLPPGRGPELPQRPGGGTTSGSGTGPTAPNSPASGATSGPAPRPTPRGAVPGVRTPAAGHPGAPAPQYPRNAAAPTGKAPSAGALPSGTPVAPGPGTPGTSGTPAPGTTVGLPEPRPEHSRPDGRAADDQLLADVALLDGPGAGNANGPGDQHTVGLRRPEAGELIGQAELRRSERGLTTHSGSGDGNPATATPSSRLEARRAERAQRPGPAIVASRFLGEVLITCGVLMLLFVIYQLWWTNWRADREAGKAEKSLLEQWENPKQAAAVKNDSGEHAARTASFAPGEEFALLHAPSIELTAPVAEGVSKRGVLDKGMVGHYSGKPTKSAMPWEKKGNFALAGHRNTHGEPFRYINRLVEGDNLVVETSDTYYTYEVRSRLPSTSPSNTEVIGPVPARSGFTAPGRYITLTTCTPEFTSKYRLIVWGKMVDERPRGEGRPDVLDS
ncbi:class E sortase [Streptomyces sp. AJS327]|nr:class E sortase [Streptomyces sp. AJS327]